MCGCYWLIADMLYLWLLLVDCGHAVSLAVVGRLWTCMLYLWLSLVDCGHAIYEAVIGRLQTCYICGCCW